MKRTFVILGALCSGLFSGMAAMAAEPELNIIATREANSTEGKILTMEETILARSLSPEWKLFTWKENTGHRLVLIDEGKEILLDINGKKEPRESGIIQSPDQKIPKLVKHCRNVDESPYARTRRHIYAFTVRNNLFICDSVGNIDTVTSYSRKGGIVAGDIVSRNEFGISKGTFWSPDARKLAFYIKDESDVTAFPLFDITTRTGSTRYIKYPMAGMDSERLALCIYNTESKRTVTIDHVTIARKAGWDRPAETYITNVCWSPDASFIYAQLLDRSQKHMMLCRFDEFGTFVDTVLTEDDSRYVEPLDPLYFIEGQNGTFIYRTAVRDGYRSLYLCDNKHAIRRITDVDADVDYVGNDGKYVYYMSAEVSPVENHLFRIAIKDLKKGVMNASFGKPERLTHEPGWHTVTMSPDHKMFIDTYSSLNVPRITDLREADGKLVRNLLAAEDPTLDYSYGEISLGTVKSADGLYDNYFRLVKPADFDPSKKYPLIVYVYGGPHSQMVRNTYMAELRRWEMYMAQRGYIVYVQDNRGTQNRGLAFEQAIYGQCGQAEMADQMVGVNALMKLPYIDKDRIGVHGWSYGGFMTISLMTNYPEVFKVGVAGGPVIDWKWYEVMYGERYMGSPHSNQEGYEKVSLIPRAKDLKGKLLVCQGVIDPVVVWENSLSFIRECIVNNVQVDYFPYPRAEHNVMGKDRVHLMDKVSIYFEDYLK